MPQTCLLVFSNFEQNQSKVYQEVLIAGDLTEEDVSWGVPRLYMLQFGWPSYGKSIPATTEFVHDKDTVYFAQPTPSQFTHDGSGHGTFNQSDTLNNTSVLTGRNASRSDTGVVLRYENPAG